MTETPPPRADHLPDDDEQELRRRLAAVRAARPKIEELNKANSEAVQANIGQLSAVIQRVKKYGAPVPDADDVRATNTFLTEMARALHESWVAMSEEEARIRQALGLIASERHTEASIQAAEASNTLADAANRQTAALVKWTKWLAAATVALALATVVLVMVTATSGS